VCCFMNPLPSGSEPEHPGGLLPGPQYCFRCVLNAPIILIVITEQAQKSMPVGELNLLGLPAETMRRKVPFKWLRTTLIAAWKKTPGVLRLLSLIHPYYGSARHEDISTPEKVSNGFCGTFRDTATITLPKNEATSWPTYPWPLISQGMEFPLGYRSSLQDAERAGGPCPCDAPARRLPLLSSPFSRERDRICQHSWYSR
jgi:hypothetical protein